MNKNYKVEKLEDMPRYIPIIFIQDRNGKPEIIGNNKHDVLVIENGGTSLSYYNSQCGEGSHKCSDFRFVKGEPTCLDDEFYSKWCQMVDLEEMIENYTSDLQHKLEVAEKALEKMAEYAINDNSLYDLVSDFNIENERYDEDHFGIDTCDVVDYFKKQAEKELKGE